jgi:NDP-sugar pyrophosphorylase family protein
VLPALVLCAGVGSRLDPITRLVAKAAVPVAGRTLIERVLGWLEAQHVHDVAINLHHRPETITGIVGDGAHLGLHVRYSWEREILGSAGGPRHALPLLDSKTFFIVNGDTLCDVNLADVADAHAGSRADVTLVLVPNPARDHYNGVVVDDGRIVGVIPKGHQQPTWHFIGIQVVRADLFGTLEDGVPAETMSELYREHFIARDWNIRAHCVDLPFIDVGTPNDYRRAALRLAGTDSAIEEGASIAASARVRQSVVWRGASIGADATLDECVVLDGVSVAQGFEARRAVLFPAALLRPGEQAEIVDGVAQLPCM